MTQARTPTTALPRLAALAGGACLLVAGACAEDPGAESFHLELRNDAPDQPTLAVERIADEVDADDPVGLGPGESSSVELRLPPGARLQLITMFSESNDCFVAFPPGGIDVWSGTEAMVGDRSGELGLWDAGTELNGPPGLGPDQGPRQSAADQGSPVDGTVERLSSSILDPTVDEAGNVYPPLASFVRVELEQIEGDRFRVTLDNVSNDQTLELPEGDAIGVHLSPGLAFVQLGTAAAFELGEPASGALERLAEAGDPDPLFARLSEGPGGDLRPLLAVVHEPEFEIFAPGERAGVELERYTEAGEWSPLLRRLEQRPGVIEARVPRVAPLAPGERLDLDFVAAPGDALTLLSPYSVGGDKLLALRGLPLFAEDGSPLEGRLDWEFALYDLGSAAGAMPEAPGHSEPNMADENRGITRVGGEWQGWTYPAGHELVEATIELAATP